MNCSVNLVPIVRRQARIRTRRRAGWIGVCAAVAAFVALGWSVQRAATNALLRLRDNVNALEVQRSEVQRSLVAANAQRTRLLEQLHTVATARRSQPWAERLVMLAREAPETVFLTAIKVDPPEADAARGVRERGGTVRPAVRISAGRDARPTVRPTLGAPGNGTSEAQAVRMLGYALDHSALLQFINTLQELPGWRQVELVRASREPFRGGVAVAFELDCRTAEGRP